MITGTTRLAAVLGHPVSHSKSPPMLNAAFAARGIDAVMVPLDIKPRDLLEAVRGLRAMRVLGASVTIPHKLGVAGLCDELSPAARAIGAVNCLQFPDDGSLVGHNTDEGGFADGLAGAGFDLKGKRCVLLGAGGAARAVGYALRQARATEVFARKPEEVRWARAWPWTDEQLRDSFGRADLIVDCTPVGLGSDDEPAWVDALPLDALPKTALVATLVYHRRPILLERAAAAGYSTLDGKAMLVHQGARAFQLWTGQPAPVAEMRAALDASLAGP